MYDAGVLRVRDSASVQVDGAGPDVHINATGSVLGSDTAAGQLFCGTAPSTTTWQPGDYDMTGDLCACTELFEQQANSMTCDSCGAAGWDPGLCACKVGGRRMPHEFSAAGASEVSPCACGPDLHASGFLHKYFSLMLCRVCGEQVASMLNPSPRHLMQPHHTANTHTHTTQ